jgi:hypothetical protein
MNDGNYHYVVNGQHKRVTICDGCLKAWKLLREA